MMVFNEIDNFIEVYNNSVIELIKCFGTSFFGRINHLASSVNSDQRTRSQNTVFVQEGGGGGGDLFLLIINGTLLF